MALSDLTRREILLAAEEYDRLGRDAFLDTYGFAPARSYLLLLNGRTYDSKAIVGVAHGYLSGQRPLEANNFSGGAATVGRLLRGLGFEVTAAPDKGPADPSPSLTISTLLDSLARLRRYRSPTGRSALYQPLTLAWAIGRAHRGLDRITPWTETENALGAFLERHGEYPRPHYPLAALYHAGLWEIDGPRPVPPAHGNAPVRWFTEHRPQSGLASPFYNLVRYSGEARVAAVEAIVDKYLAEADTDWDAILTDAGLADAEIADDQAPVATGITLPASPMEEEYRRLCGIADRMREREAKLRRARVTFDLMRSQSARRAVLRRSGGHCENPGCAGDPQDITDAGLPILEVDHIHDLALGGPDHPEQMIALCPNCHAIKTRGRTREKLRQELLTAAQQRHDALLAQSAR